MVTFNWYLTLMANTQTTLNIDAQHLSDTQYWRSILNFDDKYLNSSVNTKNWEFFRKGGYNLLRSLNWIYINLKHFYSDFYYT